jgi:xylose isomerase
VSGGFFTEVAGPIPFGGLGSTDPLTFKVYEPDRLVLGKRMEDHLRIGVCFWHSFAWPGTDMFGSGTLDRPWIAASGDQMAAARMKMAAAFEFFTKLGIPYYCFHDRDVAPDGNSFAEFKANLDALVDDAAAYQERTGVSLLWGTANLFGHPRYAAGAATNPDPEVFAYAAAQVKNMLEVTQRLGGTNYVLWGGRDRKSVV